jgi:hypothetical protein
MRISIAVVVAAIVLLSTSGGFGDAGGDAIWNAKLERSGIPELCARTSADLELAGCIRRQLDAGLQIRRLLIANREDGDFHDAVRGCAARFEPTTGSYDWIEIRSCVNGWAAERAARSLRE